MTSTNFLSKFQLTALAVSIAAAGSALAADVQLYGRVNTALFFQKIQSEEHAVARVENGASRIGLNVSETLNSD